jgi:hypothetical protein
MRISTRDRSLSAMPERSTIQEDRDAAIVCLARSFWVRSRRL